MTYYLLLVLKMILLSGGITVGFIIVIHAHYKEEYLNMTYNRKNDDIIKCQRLRALGCFIIALSLIGFVWATI